MSSIRNHHLVLAALAATVVMNASYAQGTGDTFNVNPGDTFNSNPGADLTVNPDGTPRTGGMCQGDVPPGMLAVTVGEAYSRGYRNCGACRGDGSHVVCYPPTTYRPSRRPDPQPSAATCPGLLGQAQATASAIEGGNTTGGPMIALTKVLQNCPPSFPRPIQCFAMMADAQSKVRVDRGDASRRAAEAVRCYDRTALAGDTGKGSPPASSGCHVFTMDGRPVASVQDQGGSSPSQGRPKPRGERDTGLMLAQAFQLGCSTSNLSGGVGEVPPLTGEELRVQLDDFKCDWYYRVNQAIGEEFNKLMHTPGYTSPPEGASVTERMVVVGPDLYDRPSILFASGTAIDDSNMQVTLGPSGDAVMAAFVRAALAAVSNRRADVLAFPKDWRTAVPANRAASANGRRLYHGIMLTSVFTYDPVAFEAHQYNVACLQWIRGHKDPGAVGYPGAPPLKLEIR